MAGSRKTRGPRVIVADANIVAALYFDSTATVDARRLLELDGDWVVPDLWRHEMLNIAANYAKFAQSGLAGVTTGWGQADAVFGARQQPVDMSAALALAAKYHISAYDAQYVALARKLGVHLVSLDKKLLAAVPGTAISLREAITAGESQ